MSYQCVSENCEHPIELGWSFCPACGCDNRPPAERKKVGHHYHRFLWKNKGYCLICGEPAGEPYAFGYRMRIYLSLASGIASVGFGVYAALLYWHDRLLGSPFGNWAHSWAHTLIQHRSRRRRYSNSSYYTTELGNDMATWSAIGSLVLFILALALLLKYPFSKGNSLWNDYDIFPSGRRRL